MGRAKSIREIAQRDSIPQRYVSKTIHGALIASDLIERRAVLQGVGSLSFLASIAPLLSFQLFDTLVQLVEACVPEQVVSMETSGLTRCKGAERVLRRRAPPR
jgi:hypothetical protein